MQKSKFLNDFKSLSVGGKQIFKLRNLFFYFLPHVSISNIMSARKHFHLNRIAYNVGIRGDYLLAAGEFLMHDKPESV